MRLLGCHGNTSFSFSTASRFLELGNSNCHLQPILSQCHVSVLLSNTVFTKNISSSKRRKLEVGRILGACASLLSVEHSFFGVSFE